MKLVTPLVENLPADLITDSDQKRITRKQTSFQLPSLDDTIQYIP